MDVGGERPGRIFTTMNDPGRESHCSQVKQLGRARARDLAQFSSVVFWSLNCSQ